MRSANLTIGAIVGLLCFPMPLITSTADAQLRVPSQRPLPPFAITTPPSPKEPESKSVAAEAAKALAPASRPDSNPQLLISIRTEKAIYKNGERVKLIGKVLNRAGELPVSSIVDLRVYRKLTQETGEGGTGASSLGKAIRSEELYRTLLEPKTSDFSDDGYAIQFPGQEALFVTKQFEFEVRAEVIPRGAGEGSLAVTTFAAEEIGYLNLLEILLVITGGIMYVLLLIYLVFVREPTKRTARNMLLAIFGSGLFFLLVALGGPLLISLSPSTEVLLRTTPVGIAKATTEKLKDLQWMINIGGVVGSDSTLKGGYGIPLFILILGVVGGVISMLLKLPEFLHEYDQIPEGAMEEAVKVSELRAKVFRYFVYILTGPFLGMMAFSLATLADYTNALALSIIAFSVGFISDQIVESMLAVAGNVLTRSKEIFKKP